ncbi:MAG: thiamine phosphate synthase [Caulobacterales bacterium]
MVCRRRGLILLIGADVMLAQQVRADGVHLPERLVSRRPHRTRGLITAAAHSRAAAVRAQNAGARAIFLSPVLPSRSPSAVKSLGARKAAGIAQTVQCPVFALGGINAKSARRLQRPGFSGLAGIEAFAPDQKRKAD